MFKNKCYSCDMKNEKKKTHKSVNAIIIKITQNDSRYIHQNIKLAFENTVSR